MESFCSSQNFRSERKSTPSRSACTRRQRPTAGGRTKCRSESISRRGNHATGKLETRRRTNPIRAIAGRLRRPLRKLIRNARIFPFFKLSHVCCVREHCAYQPELASVRFVRRLQQPWASAQCHLLCLHGRRRFVFGRSLFLVHSRPGEFETATFAMSAFNGDFAPMLADNFLTNSQPQSRTTCSFR